MTYDETTELKRRLERIADTPRRAPQLDVAVPAARGRRVLRARRTSSAAGTALAVGLVATFTVTGLPGRGGEPDRPATQVAASPSHPNPLVQRAAFGWLPQGHHVVSAIEDHQGGRDTFELDASGGISLTDFGEGPEPALGNLHLGKPARRLPAEPVKGHKAYWIAKPGTQDGGRLRWQYGPGRWAELEVRLGPLDKTETIYRIAESITFGTATPTAFPFQVRGFPSGVKPYRSIWRRGASGEQGVPGSEASLMFAAKAPSPNDSLDLSVTEARPLAEYASSEGTGFNTTVDGHPAIDQRYERGKLARQMLVVTGVNGFDIRIDASGEPLRRLEKIGGVMGLYRRITVLGTDPSRWTTTPLG